MFRYSAFSLSLDSEIDLPGLPLSSASADVRIRRGTVEWPRPATPREETACPSGVGRFHVADGQTITFAPLPSATPEGVRTVLTGRVMAYLLRQRGAFPLHASAVYVAGRAVLFLGASGAGKSTAAAFFHAHGHSTLTDEVAALHPDGGCLWLSPSASAVRLCGDAAAALPFGRTGSSGDKQITLLDRPPVPAAIAVARIYSLVWGDDPVRAEPVTDLESLAILNSHSFIQPARSTPELRTANLRRAAAVVALVPVSRLVRPRSFARLADLVALVEKDVTARP